MINASVEHVKKSTEIDELKEITFLFMVILHIQLEHGKNNAQYNAGDRLHSK